MGNRADEYGTDVEIYRKALASTIHADTATGAPEELLGLLDRLGLERREVRTAGPVYIWHEAPADLDTEAQQRLVSRAIPVLLRAGYTVNCTPEVFNEAAYQQAVRELRTAPSSVATQRQTPAAAPKHPAPARRTP